MKLKEKNISIILKTASLVRLILANLDDLLL